MTGSDYVHPSQAAVTSTRRRRFNPGTTTSRDGNIEITICDDTIPEEDPESFEVYITNELVQNAFISPYRVATVTIVDNDVSKWCMVQQGSIIAISYGYASSLCLDYDLHLTHM